METSPERMRIVVGIQSEDEVEPLAAAGAGGFFAGLLAGDLESGSRPATPRFNLPDEAAFARAARRAQAGGAELHLVLNEPCEAPDRKAYDRLVDSARAAGAAGVILGDLALLERFRREGRDLGRVAVSCMAGALNAEAFRPFVDLGADRLICDRETTPGEMRALAGRFPGAEIEAFAFFDKCNHVDAFCRAMDLLRATGGGEGFPGECLCLLARRARLAPLPGAEHLAPRLPALLDHLVWRPGCAACRVPALAGAGVASLKVAGRGWALEAKLRAVAMLSRAIERHAAGADGERIAAESRAAFAELFGRPCGEGDCYGGRRFARPSAAPPPPRRETPPAARIPPAPREGGIGAAFFPRDPEPLSESRLAAVVSAGYGRIYAGSEFCARLLPSAESLIESRRAAARSGLAFTLVTPPLFESEFAAASATLARFLAEAGDGTEVVVNDLGLLRRFLAGDFPPPQPSLGRCLAALADYADGAEALAARGIARVETDTPRDFPARTGFALSRYVPRRFLNFTRFCPFAETLGGHGPEACGRECLGGGYRVEAGGLREPVEGIGNAHFLPASPGAARPHPAVDRIVVVEP